MDHEAIESFVRGRRAMTGVRAGAGSVFHCPPTCGDRSGSSPTAGNVDRGDGRLAARIGYSSAPTAADATGAGARGFTKHPTNPTTDGVLLTLVERCDRGLARRPD